MTSAQLAGLAARLLEDKKAASVLVIDVRRLSSETDYFVVASGNTANQIRAMADYVETRLEEAGLVRHHTEGYQTGRWVLLDYGMVVIHVLHQEERGFYDLERLWGDAPLLQFAGA